VYQYDVAFPQLFVFLLYQNWSMIARLIFLLILLIKGGNLLCETILTQNIDI